MFRSVDKQYIDRVIMHARSLLPYCKRRNILGFFFDAMTHAALYVEWFDYLETRLPKSMPSDIIRRLVERTARRYLRRWFNSQKKIDVLRCHYDMFAARFSPATLELMRTYPGVLLAELAGNSGHRYKICLYQSMTKEGEIAFCFMDTERAAELATIRGTFGSEAYGHKLFWIGAIQGPPPPQGYKAISYATRDLNVLRPKQAVLHAICAFCAWSNIDTIYAPPHENHISYRWWRPWFTRHKILSDYDGFWQEFTAERTTHGDFHLSLPLARRKPEDVLSKRRKDWIRRYARVDALTESTTTTLDSLSSIGI